MNNQDTFLNALRRLPSGIIEDITKRADELTPYDPTGVIAPTIKTLGSKAVALTNKATNSAISFVQSFQGNKEKTDGSKIKIQMFYSGRRLCVKSNSNLDNQKIGGKTLKEIFNSKNPNVQPAGHVSPVQTTEFFKISSPLSTDKIYDVEIEPKQFNSVNNQTTYLLNFKFSPDISKTDPDKPNLPPLPGSTVDPKQYQIEFNALSSLIIINDDGKITPIGIQKPRTNSSQGYDKYSKGLVSGSRIKENAYSDMDDKFGISTDNDNSKKYGEPTLENQVEGTQTTGLIQSNTQTGYLYLVCDKHDRLNGNTEVTCKIIKFSVTKNQNPVQIATIVDSKVYDCIDKNCKISVLNNRILISDENDVCLLSNSLSVTSNQNIIFGQQNNLCKSTTPSGTSNTQTSTTSASTEKETTNDSTLFTTDNLQSTTADTPSSSDTTDLSTLTDKPYTTIITKTTDLSTKTNSAITTTSNSLSTASTASDTTENSHTITHQNSNSASTDHITYTSYPITSIEETTSYQNVNTINIEYTSTNNEHMSTNFSTNSSTLTSAQSTSTKNIPSTSITTTLITKSNSPTTNTKTSPSTEPTTRNTTLSTNSPSSNSMFQSTSYTPSSSTNNENNQSNGLSNGAISGIAIGATITLGALIYGTKKLYDWYNNKEIRESDIEMQTVDQAQNNPSNKIKTETSWLSRLNPFKLYQK